MMDTGVDDKLPKCDYRNSENTQTTNNTRNADKHPTRASKDNTNNDDLPTTATTVCTCRKLLSRQPNIKRTCTCGKSQNNISNNNNMREADETTKRRLQNSTTNTDQQGNCKDTKMKQEQKVNDNNDKDGSGSDHDNRKERKQDGSQNEDFGFDDIDLEASMYPETVFWCLHSKSRWRKWSIRMTQSPYPFQMSKYNEDNLNVFLRKGDVPKASSKRFSLSRTGHYKTA